MCIFPVKKGRSNIVTGAKNMTMLLFTAVATKVPHWQYFRIACFYFPFSPKLVLFFWPITNTILFLLLLLF